MPCAAARTQAELFSQDGQLVQLREGRLVAINKEGLRAIVAKHIRSVRLINRGSADAPRWEREYFEFDFPPAASD
jgi:hypothetical protein